MLQTDITPSRDEVIGIQRAIVWLVMNYGGYKPENLAENMGHDLLNIPRGPEITDKMYPQPERQT